MTACGAHDCVWRAQAAAEVAARTIDANRKHTHFLSAPTLHGHATHLHQVGRQAQMTQLKYYPKAQIRQGADRDRTLRVDDLSPQTSHRLDNCHCARRTKDSDEQ